MCGQCIEGDILAGGLPMPKNTVDVRSTGELRQTTNVDISVRKAQNMSIIRESLAESWVLGVISVLLIIIGVAAIFAGSPFVAISASVLGLTVGSLFVNEAPLQLLFEHRKYAAKAISNSMPTPLMVEGPADIPVRAIDQKVPDWNHMVSNEHYKTITDIQDQARELNVMAHNGQLSSGLREELNQIVGEHLVTAVTTYIEVPRVDGEVLRVGNKTATESLDRQLSLLGGRVAEIAEIARTTAVKDLRNHEFYLEEKFGRSQLDL